MVASVPEAQKRSRSQAGLSLQISSASASEFSFTQAKFAPSAAWRTTASVTSGRACPTSTEPQPMEKSRYVAPEVSSTSHPSPRPMTVQSSGGEIEFSIGACGKHPQRALDGVRHFRFGHGQGLKLNLCGAVCAPERRDGASSLHSCPRRRALPRRPNGKKRPGNVIGCAVKVVQIVTGEFEDDPPDEGRRRGGKARADGLTADTSRPLGRGRPIAFSAVIAFELTGHCRVRIILVYGQHWADRLDFRAGGPVRQYVLAQQSSSFMRR